MNMTLVGVSRGAVACLALSMIAGCKPAPVTTAGAESATVDPAKVTAEVKAAILTQVEAYASRDPIKAASIAAPDMLGMFHGEPNVVGKDAVLAQIKAQMSDPALKLEVRDETVDVAASGELAVYRATYSFTYTNPATTQPAVELGNWVAVFKRQNDGTMKMSKDMVLDMPATANARP